MIHRPALSRNYVSSRDTDRLGLNIGRKIGLLDPSNKFATRGAYPLGEWDSLHQSITVVDAYSAAVDLELLQVAGINVVIQGFSAEELYAQIPTHEANQSPPPGVKTWRHVFNGSELIERVDSLIKEHLDFVEAYKDYIELAQSGKEIQEIVKRGKIAMIMMLMSGLIDNDLETLRKYRAKGLTVMALCHLGAMNWSDSTAELNKIPGLTEFGREVVAECNDLGILIDLAHASDETCFNALETSTRPMIVTHSKCRALSNSMRDISDDLMRKVAGQGGVVGILAPAPRTGHEAQKSRLRRDSRLSDRYSDPFELTAAKLDDAFSWGTKLDVRSINHAVNVAGIDHVGLASHFQNVPQWREFTSDLIEYGYSEENTKKILGGNVLRIIHDGIG